MTDTFVLHDSGDERGGAPWADALDAVAPDLPGHGREPAPIGGSYEIGDAVFFALQVLRDRPLGSESTIVGVGVNGWSAWVLALAGRAGRLVLVDGLGGPWRTPGEAIDAGRDWLRAVSADPEAMAPPPPSGLDPRLRHRFFGMGDRAFVERAAAATPVPVVLVESPGSPVDPEDASALAALFPEGADVVRVPDREPATVAAALAAAGVS